MNCCKSEYIGAKISWAKREIPVLLLRRFKSEYHARRWVDYEKILEARTLFSMISRIILNIVFVITG